MQIKVTKALKKKEVKITNIDTSENQKNRTHTHTQGRYTHTKITYYGNYQNKTKNYAIYINRKNIKSNS